MAFSCLHKVNRLFVLQPPSACYDFSLRFIQVDEAAGRQDRLHCQILAADISVSRVELGKIFQVNERNRTPLFHSIEHNIFRRPQPKIVAREYNR
jgi:hypothetical protein